MTALWIAAYLSDKSLDVTRDDINVFDSRGFGDSDPSVKMPPRSLPSANQLNVHFTCNQSKCVLESCWEDSRHQQISAIPFLVIIFTINHSSWDYGESKAFACASRFSKLLFTGYFAAQESARVPICLQEILHLLCWSKFSRTGSKLPLQVDFPPHLQEGPPPPGCFLTVPGTSHAPPPVGLC